ncbi:MAG: hypothetical protein A3E78_09495 [Alphaproteobacteria bacterium RIFCSPHIGHO2_12_FULL_63_12]|nr:MAG: hypothetical protein A3E78_09495 [Alphaproteobacteria bacterium RIFCSPHIGHO2_12_FULL_63_12]
MATDPNIVTSDELTAEDVAAAETAADDQAPEEETEPAEPVTKPKAEIKVAKKAPAIGDRVKKGAPPPAEPVVRAPNSVVMVRVTKTGHGKVHDGRGAVYDWNDEVPLPYGVALAQEKNSNVEIIG